MARDVGHRGGASADLQAVRGGMLLALLAVPLLVPALERWPSFLLASLLAYFLIVWVLATLWRTIRWARVG